MNRDRGKYEVAEDFYKRILKNTNTSSEMITKSSLAIAKIRSDMDKPGLSDYTISVRKTASRWGGWMELKTAEILDSLETFRLGLYGKGLKELFKHVRESDESAYAVPRLRSRIAIAEALIEAGDYSASKRFLAEVGKILTSMQHSSLKFIQSYTELLWSKADIREVSNKDRLLEALDRLEILLAVVAKYPRPPGPSPFWLVIGEIQEKLGQHKAALRSYRKAMLEGEKIGSHCIAVSAGYALSVLQWNLLSEEQKHQGSERNRILAQTTHLLELLANVERPENQWRIHYLRGKIFFESGEQYPAREEMKTAAKIAGSVIYSFEDPALQKTYRRTEIRAEAFADLQEYFDPEKQSIIFQGVELTGDTDVSRGIGKETDKQQLQSVLSALYEIHSSDHLESMINTLLNWCLQILSSDRAKFIPLGKNSKDADNYCKFRSDGKHSEDFDIPEIWVREASGGAGMFTYIRHADDTNPVSRYSIIGAIRKRKICQGIVYLDRPKSDGQYNADEVRILKTLTSVAAIAFSSLSIRSRLSDLTDQFRREIIPEFPHIIGESPSMNDVFIQMQRVAPADVPILVQGETGTGKDLVARTIHEISSRSEAPLVHLDCSSIPETLLESELFGIAEGIATGVESRLGLLEYADGGTILLDEVGDIPLNTQAKLLRVLQEREFEPVGSDKVVKVNIRVMSTTSRNLRKLISSAEMREDFYYRLSGVVINIPPLRDRPGDVLLMARTFLQKYNRDFKKSIKGFTAELLDAMAGYPWLGNVRELDHMIRKAVLFCQGERLSLADMELPVVKGREVTLKIAIESMEKEAVKDALELTKNDKVAVIRALGISLKKLEQIMNKESFTAQSQGVNP
ncbi:sigma 54-interacting transcriptional regulator [bacterium]|nr:sigma 54-interacting transcriptional regulator [bacterium]